MAKEKSTKDRRRSKRTDKPASVIYFNDQKCPTRNLSVGGALIQEYGDTLSAGSLLEITGISPAGGKQIKILIRARINRVLPDSEEIASQFLSLDDSAYEILQNIMVGRI